MSQKENQQDFKVYLSARTIDPSGEPAIPPSDRLEYYIVQFNKSLTEEDRDRLRNKYHLRLDQYLPNFAFLERVDFKTVNDLTGDPLHRASAAFLPDYKISQEIGASGPYSAARIHLNGFLIRVFLFRDISKTEIAQVVKAIDSLRGSMAPGERMGAQTETFGQQGSTANGKADGQSAMQFDPNEIRILEDRELGGQVQLVLVLPSLELLPLIAKLDEVQWIEEVVEADSDSAVTVHCPGLNTVAGTIQSGDPQNTPVWNNHINGDGQSIGIIDAQLVDVGHCMFRDRPSVPVGPTHRKVVAFRASADTTQGRHGTAVAAIAVADELGLSGQNANRGIAWLAKLSYDDQNFIRHEQKTLLELLDQQSRDEVMIHSNSWHDRTREYNKTAVDVDRFVWTNEEHFVCGSSGNSGANEVLGPPGTAKNALCVSASFGHPRHQVRGDGLIGPTKDTRRKPEICAPGAGIHTARAGSGCGCRTVRCATSFATPVIAGAAALIRQYYFDGFHHSGAKDTSKSSTASAALVKATLLNSTIPMTQRRGDTDYPNNRTGWGLIKLDNTLFFTGNPRRLFVADVRNADGLTTGESRAHQITVESNAATLKITLVWSDPPALLFAAGKTLINNLDLVVTSPDGSAVFIGGNSGFVDGFSQPMPDAPAADELNNVEMVIVKEPAAGCWTIRVVGTAVNLERQGYALVATGALAQVQG